MDADTEFAGILDSLNQLARRFQEYYQKYPSHFSVEMSVSVGFLLQVIETDLITKRNPDSLGRGQHPKK